MYKKRPIEFRKLLEQNIRASEETHRHLLSQLRKNYPVLGPYEFEAPDVIVVKASGEDYKVSINDAPAQYDDYEVIVRDYSGTVLSAESVQDAEGVLPATVDALMNVR